MDGEDGSAAWLPCCRISHYLQSWDNEETLSPLCVVAASEYRAARELAERSWMATMLSNIAVFALLVQWEDTHPTLLGGD